MPNALQNTWAYGLQRLILGYAAGQTEGTGSWQGVLPLPQVSGLSALKVGYLAQWLEAVAISLSQLSATHTPAEWCSVMHKLMARFFKAESESDERILLRLKQELTQWQSLCEQAGLSEPLPLTVVREHWLSSLESAGLQQRFFGGGVQFSTLMPMRAISCMARASQVSAAAAGAPRKRSSSDTAHALCSSGSVMRVSAPWNM